MSLKRIIGFSLILFITFSINVQASSKQEIDTDAGYALKAFYELSPGNKELVSKASGMLVFPTVMKAGFVVGGEYGEGVLQIAGKPVEYYSIASASFGLQIGAQARSEIILFMDKDALENFRAHDGWSVGVDGSVAVVDMGAAKDINTETTKDPIIAFIFSSKGLMGNLSLEGSKFSKISR